MTDLSKHPFFERWIDPQTGVESFILAEHAAPVQQSFYFVNPSLSADGRWLWFYAAFPPSPHRMLGVVSMDPSHPRIQLFPGTAGAGESAMVAPEGDASYFCLPPAVWHQPVAGEPRKVCELDMGFSHQHRLRITRLATHLTLSADGKYFLLDGAMGQHWFVALGELASGRVTILREFFRHHNHAQFSPVDPELFLIAQDWHHDPSSGKLFQYDHRTWLMDVRQSRFEPLCPGRWYLHNSADSHEWWSADGLVCWVDYKEGVYEMSLEDRVARLVWPGPLCHAHCDGARRYWCADQSPYEWHKGKLCQVKFFDRGTGRGVDIVSAMPAPTVDRSLYHLDPHPQFSPRGDLVVYTTQVRGVSEVALAPVAGILDRL